MVMKKRSEYKQKMEKEEDNFVFEEIQSDVEGIELKSIILGQQIQNTSLATVSRFYQIVVTYQKNMQPAFTKIKRRFEHFYQLQCWMMASEQMQGLKVPSLPYRDFRLKFHWLTNKQELQFRKFWLIRFLQTVMNNEYLRKSQYMIKFAIDSDQDFNVFFNIMTNSKPGLMKIIYQLPSHFKQREIKSPLLKSHILSFQNMLNQLSHLHANFTTMVEQLKKFFSFCKENQHIIEYGSKQHRTMQEYVGLYEMQANYYLILKEDVTGYLLQSKTFKVSEEKFLETWEQDFELQQKRIQDISLNLSKELSCKLMEYAIKLREPQ